MELFRALATLIEPPARECERISQALGFGPLPSESEYTETFLFQLYPYASVYLGAEGMMGGEARDRIAGFWRALGLTPPAEPDHLSIMLALYAQLVELDNEDEKDAARREQHSRARRAFLWEHLLSWLPVYLTKLEELATPFYSKWAETLKEVLLEEAERTGSDERLSLHLREAHALIDPREHGAEEFLRSLLAPAPSGMILTRADLGRASRSLDLGLRLGERRFILKSLFSQDAKGVLGWLRAEALLWRDRHHLNQQRLGAIAAAWKERAESSAKLLAELESSAEN